jgi:hypothetical protein
MHLQSSCLLSIYRSQRWPGPAGENGTPFFPNRNPDPPAEIIIIIINQNLLHPLVSTKTKPRRRLTLVNLLITRQPLLT